MLAGMALATVLAGVVLGRLYSFLAVLIVSPLVWLVATVAASAQWSLFHACLTGVAALFLLHACFLLGVRLRLHGRSEAREARPADKGSAVVRTTGESAR